MKQSQRKHENKLKMDEYIKKEDRKPPRDDATPDRNPVQRLFSNPISSKPGFTSSQNDFVARVYRTTGFICEVYPIIQVLITGTVKFAIWQLRRKR